MFRLFSVLSDIWKVEELRRRILYTLLLIAVYRLGSYIILPGINPEQLATLLAGQRTGLPGLINLFAGGAFSRASLFALGIMPYISASIIVQLLGVSIPYFQRLQMEGESGRRKLNQITRYLTVLVTLVQANGYITFLYYMAGEAIVAPKGLFWFTTVILLTTGTLFVMWLGEKITDRGIGNGISLIIMIGIIAELPFALAAEFTTKTSQPGGMVFFVLEIAFLTVVILGVIALTQAVRRIPLQYSRRVVGGRVYQGARQYIPFRVNAAGVMPIIFAQALMFIPTMVGQFFPRSAFMQKMMVVLGDYTSLWYNVLLFVLVVLFTYFYTAVIYNPIQMAEDMKRNGAFIPGVKPGKKTAEYIDTVISHVTLPGAIFLGAVAILPSFAEMAGVGTNFAVFFGGTTLLILVAVMLDTLQQIEAHLLMRHYEGLTRTGRLRGRTPIVGI